MRTRIVVALLLVALTAIGLAQTQTPAQVAVSQALALLAPLEAQLTGPARTNLRSILTRIRTLQTQLPMPIDCAVSPWSAWQAGAWGECVNNSQLRPETRTRTILSTAANGGLVCPALIEMRTVPQDCVVAPPGPPPPPPTTLPIWGVTATDIMGTCTVADHDKYVLDGGDGFRYRTWHPQADSSGCVFGHEHGDNPQTMVMIEIRDRPIYFGWVGRRMQMGNEPNGHEEPHEGFKVFVANPGLTNDEGRVNRVYSRSVFHMGTGGTGRFNARLHSGDIAVFHPEFNLKAYTRLLMDTGGNATVCDPRQPAPTKDVVSLGSPCLLNSTYEIWSTQQIVRYQGREIYRSFATPAVFDPVTVFNPANPGETIYAWDPRVESIMRFKGDDRKGYRGCDRENYAQPGYWYNAASGRDTFYTDVLGQEVAATHPLAIAQTISQSNSVGAPATSDGLNQFKMRQSWCQNQAALGLKN